MKNSSTVFHSSVRAVLICVVSLAVMVGSALFFLCFNLPVDWRALAGGLAAGLMAAVVLSYAVRRLFSIEVSQTGIRAHSFWGQRKSIAWGEVESVRPVRFLNLRYLRLYHRPSESPVWMALFYPNYPEFQQAVIKVAPSGSPILTHL